MALKGEKGEKQLMRSVCLSRDCSDYDNGKEICCIAMLTANQEGATLGRKGESTLT